jgi:hypothetical protein
MTESVAVERCDVVLIARHDDGVAIRLRESLQARGARVALLDGPGAGRFFTVRGDQEGTTVSPRVPVFVRPSAWWHVDTEDSADARFLRGECHAAYWAALALSGATVINRVSRTGPVHRLTAAALAALPAAGRTPVMESFASGPDRFEEAEGLWGEDIDYRTGELSTLRADVPVRVRRVEVDAGYEIVTVVGARAFAATTHPRTLDASLGARSVDLVTAAGLHFATVTWALTADEELPVRLNPAPEESELRYVWSDVSAALCDDLWPAPRQDAA